MTKILAFFLPQYHTIPENDQWWGKGFTEWTNVRKAKPLFYGHYQPRVPLNHNYYNLLDPETRLWQADLAKKYGIYGFCYYHYWFKGKQLLEKPFDAVLQSGEPDLPFCLCWANEPWTRSWDGKESDVLMPQKYGEQDDWEKHFYYLLTAFQDKRYIKVDNQPMFVIYRTGNIPCCDEMIEFWNKLARQNGFAGIHLVEMLNTFQNKSFCQYSKALLEFEPLYTLAYDKPYFLKKQRKIFFSFKKTKLGSMIIPEHYPDRFNYDLIWRRIVKRKHLPTNKLIYLGAFVDWDNTPRKDWNGIIFQGANPQKFKKYLEKQLRRSEKLEKSDFIFINAWNEWAEGTYLEPDQKYEYAYLQAIKEVIYNKNK